MNGKVSVVGTPIGNLEDVTLRALRTLKEADVVLCEDTRVTKKLLSHFDIHTSLRRYDAHTSDARYEEILSMLAEGKHLALVSDAGTPTISDPGSHLIDRIRREAPECVIEAVPGPSALTAALSVMGMSASTFTFLGFLPHKKGRQTLFAQMAASPVATVFYESPHRIVKTLESLAESLAPERTIAVARELTKLHEEVIRGSASEVLQKVIADSNRQRGEFVILVEGSG